MENDVKTAAVPKMYEEETDPRLTAGTHKWQAGPGYLFCQKKVYQPNKSVIIRPGQATKDHVYLVLSVGPDVTGYKEGDIIAAHRAGETTYGLFVKVTDICGRLVPNSAPNSAVGVPANGTVRGGVEVPAGVDTGKLVEDMTAAD
jgi:hypothetical protein